MRITYESCEPSKAQATVIESLSEVVVRPVLTTADVVATLTSVSCQEIKITIGQNGIIKHVELVDD